MSRSLAPLVVLLAACGSAPVAPAAGPPPPVIVRPAAPADAPGVEARRQLDALAGMRPAEVVRAQNALLRFADSDTAVFVTTLRDADQGRSARAASAAVLAESTDPRACDALLVAWGEAEVRSAVPVALAVACGRCGVAEPLQTLATSAEEPVVRVKSAVALGSLSLVDASWPAFAGLRASTGELAGFVDVAWALAGGVDAGARLRAEVADLGALAPDTAGVFALALWRAGAREADVRDALRVAAIEHPDPVLREACIDALAAMHDRALADLVATAVDDPSPRVAARAASMR